MRIPPRAARARREPCTTGALQRCLDLYHENRDGFRALQRTDMEQDFSWNVPAGRYMELFHRMLEQ